MNRKRLPNRNRPNWLWSLSFVLVLLPFTLGQASVGGCGATVTVPPPVLDDTIIDTPDDTFVDTDGDGFSDDEEINSIPGTDPNDPTDNPDNVRDTDGDGCSNYDELNFSGYCDNDPNTPVDSDGDGFSDDDEINSIPGTDPNDPTDNPNNVRDSDGDGCSNYDELNFPGFCDNDPNTPPACDTTFYNAEHGYGFNPPTGAIDEGDDENQGNLLSHHWTYVIPDNVLVVIGTWVQDDPFQSLERYVTNLNQLEEDRGSQIVDSFPYPLADGRDAYLTVLIQDEGLVLYRIESEEEGLVYGVTAVIDAQDYTDYAHDFMISVLDSLCID